MDKIKILFLAANPFKDLNLDKEIRSITEKIRASEYRDSLQLISASAVRPDDLLQLLNEHKPHIIHFSGHGSESGEIILLDNNDLPKPVSARAIKALMSTLKDNVKAIILNACYSIEQAKAITEVVNCAVGMNSQIGDDAAIVFSASFYRAVGFGRSVQEAFDQGVVALILEGITEEATPELLLKDGVDPTKTFFWTTNLKSLGEADIALSISISNDFTEDSISKTYGFTCEKEERTLRYQTENNSNKLCISPQMDYLTKLETGTPITDLGLVLVHGG